MFYCQFGLILIALALNVKLGENVVTKKRKELNFNGLGPFYTALPLRSPVVICIMMLIIRNVPFCLQEKRIVFIMENGFLGIEFLNK